MICVNAQITNGRPITANYTRLRKVTVVSYASSSNDVADRCPPVYYVWHWQKVVILEGYIVVFKYFFLPVIAKCTILEWVSRNVLGAYDLVNTSYLPTTITFAILKYDKLIFIVKVTRMFSAPVRSTVLLLLYPIQRLHLASNYVNIQLPLVYSIYRLCKIVHTFEFSLLSVIIHKW